MKKLSLILCFTLCLSLLAGCTGTTVVYTDCTCDVLHSGTMQETTVQNVPVAAEGAVKTGLAVVASVTTTSATAEAEGKASYDVSLVAVLVDDEGVIVDCIIDSIGADVTYDTTGTILTGVNANVQTKNELGDNYNMMLYTGGAAAGEWYEQADALAKYAVGKTVEELKTGAVGQTGYAQDADLATSATIYLGGYVAAVEAAVANARHLGARSGDELKLASVNAVSVEGDLTCDAVALTMSGDMITSCYIDSLQAEITINGDGTAVAGNTKTKNELGYDYGMVAYTGGAAIGEWFEQTANFCAYVTGKTAAEVAGIAVTETTAPAEADLAASVTIAIGGFQALIAKAAQ